MMVHMSEEQAFSVSLGHLVNSDEIKRVLIVPRKYARDVRKDIARCLASHILGNVINDDIPEEASDAVSAFTASKEWAEMINATKKNDLMPRFVLGNMLASLFVSLESEDIVDSVSKSMRALRKKVSSFVRTMDILLSVSPANGFNYAVRDAHSELMSYASKYENLIERNDDLELMSGMMRFMESEITERKENKCNADREILTVIDTSESMYGEPELIAKGLSLALTKQMLRHDNDVGIMLFSSDLPVLFPSDGRDMMELLSFRGGNGKPFHNALGMLLEKMRQGLIVNTDLILVSKGTGVINDPNFTRDWESYKTNNDVRVITAVAGGDSACGLTELSDDIVIFSDAAIRGKRGEFAKLTDILSS